MNRKITGFLICLILGWGAFLHAEEIDWRLIKDTCSPKENDSVSSITELVLYLNLHEVLESRGIARNQYGIMFTSSNPGITISDDEKDSVIAIWKSRPSSFQKGSQECHLSITEASPSSTSTTKLTAPLTFQNGKRYKVSIPSGKLSYGANRTSSASGAPKLGACDYIFYGKTDGSGDEQPETPAQTEPWWKLIYPTQDTVQELPYITIGSFSRDSVKNLGGIADKDGDHATARLIFSTTAKHQNTLENIKIEYGSNMKNSVKVSWDGTLYDTGTYTFKIVGLTDGIIDNGNYQSSRTLDTITVVITIDGTKYESSHGPIADATITAKQEGNDVIFTMPGYTSYSAWQTNGKARLEKWDGTPVKENLNITLKSTADPKLKIENITFPNEVDTFYFIFPQGSITYNGREFVELKARLVTKKKADTITYTYSPDPASSGLTRLSQIEVKINGSTHDSLAKPNGGEPHTAIRFEYTYKGTTTGFNADTIYKKEDVAHTYVIDFAKHPVYGPGTLTVTIGANVWFFKTNREHNRDTSFTYTLKENSSLVGDLKLTVTPKEYADSARMSTLRSPDQEKADAAFVAGDTGVWFFKTNKDDVYPNLVITYSFDFNWEFTEITDVRSLYTASKQSAGYLAKIPFNHDIEVRDDGQTLGEVTVFVTVMDADNGYATLLYDTLHWLRDNTVAMNTLWKDDLSFTPKAGSRLEMADSNKVVTVVAPQKLSKLTASSAEIRDKGLDANDTLIAPAVEHLCAATNADSTEWTITLKFTRRYIENMNDSVIVLVKAFDSLGRQAQGGELQLKYSFGIDNNVYHAMAVSPAAGEVAQLDTLRFSCVLDGSAVALSWVDFKGVSLTGAEGYSYDFAGAQPLNDAAFVGYGLVIPEAKRPTVSGEYTLKVARATFNVGSGEKDYNDSLTAVYTLRVPGQTEEPVMDTVDAPAFVGWSENAYQDSALVELHCDTVGAKIFFRRGENGAFAEYTKAFYVYETTKVFAFGTKEGLVNSDTLYREYTVTKTQPTPVDTFYTITVLANDTTMGTVSGGGRFKKDTTVTLSAVAKDGYKFVKWNDDVTELTREVKVTANATYTATFAAQGTPVPVDTFYTITVLANDTTMGTVSGGGRFKKDTTVTLSAVAKDGYKFVKWNDDVTEPTREVKVVGDSTFTATFEKAQGVGVEAAAEVAFTVYPNPNDGRFAIEVAEDATMEIYNAGGVRVLSAFVPAGKRAVSLSGSGIYFVKMTAGGRSTVKRVIVR